MASTSISSGILAAASTTVLFDGRHTLNGITALPGAVVIVYDNTAASGKQVAVVDNTGATISQHLIFNDAVRQDIGLTVAVTGGAAIVYYGA